MSIFGGGGTASSSNNRYIGIPVQTSIKGSTLPRGWGTFKVGCNLLDYLDFKSKAASSSAGGKGGGYQNQSYTYSASVLLGLVQGPIFGIRTIYRDQSIFTDAGTTALAQAGLSLATGDIGQTPWGYLTSNHPTHAIGYSGLAYCYAQNYALNSSATLPNHSFEVQSTFRAVVSGVTLDDENGRAILNDYFATLPQWPAGAFPDPADYGDYCLAAGLLLSPLLDSQRQVSDFLTEILQATNSDCVWSDGTLKIIPYGDTEITGNGVTWTPDLTPKYDLQWENFLAPDGDDPIKWDFVRSSEAYNCVQVEYLDRSAKYVTDVQPAIDQANVDQFGLRKQDPTSLHSICDSTVAATVAQLMVQRTCNVRRTATFELPELFGLLDPMDLLTVPLRNGGRRFVRIVSYVEKPDTISIEYTVEEMLVGVGHAAEYSRQSANGIAQNLNIAPGDTAEPAIFDVPVQLAQVIGLETWIGVTGLNNPYWGGCEIWMATSSGGDYVYKATIKGGSRVGTLSADFPTGSDPDTVNTLAVDLSNCGGDLLPGTLDDANNGITLCFVDGEYVSYEQATLTSAFHYDLGKSGSTAGLLRRGFWGSQISAHAMGSLFVRLDDSVCKIPFSATDVGQTIYIKLLSFNVYGLALQKLADVTEYPHTIDGPPTIYAPESITATSVIKGVSLNWINAPNVGIAAVEIWRSGTNLFSGATHIADSAAYSTTYKDVNVASNTRYWYWIRCRDIAGNTGGYDPVTTGPGATAIAGQAQTDDLANGAVTAVKIDAGAIPAILLALSLTAVSVVTSNPPDDSLTGPLIFNSTNRQLYRWDNVGSVWTLDVPAVSITGMLTDSQLASIAAAKVSGTLVGAQIAANAIDILNMVAKDPSNLIANPSFVGPDNVGWDPANVIAVFSSSSPVPAGCPTPYCGNAINRNNFYNPTQYIPVAPGESYYLSATVATPASGGSPYDLNFGIEFYDAFHTFISQQITPTVHPTSTWTPTSGIFTVPSGAAFIQVNLGVNGFVPFGDGWYFTNAILRRATDNGLIVAAAITSDKIAANTITAANIAANTITASQIAANTITAANIAAGTITAAEIAAGTITATQLSAGSVTATQIAAGAVTAGKLDVNAVTAGTIAVGAINASAIVAANIIVTGHIQANNITNTSTASNASGDASLGVSIDPDAYAVVVSAMIDIGPFAGGSLDLLRDGSSILPATIVSTYLGTLLWVDNPGAGGHTYSTTSSSGTLAATIVVMQLLR